MNRLDDVLRGTKMTNGLMNQAMAATLWIDSQPDLDAPLQADAVTGLCLMGVGILMYAACLILRHRFSWQ